MRDSGKEDVRACSWAQEGSLLWREGEQGPGKMEKSSQEGRSSREAACLWQGASREHRRGMGWEGMLSLGKRAGDRQRGQQHQGRGRGDSSPMDHSGGTAAPGEALGARKDPEPPHMP